MKISIDTDAKLLEIDGHRMSLYSKESFEIISRQWLKVGWNERYPYCFSWRGFPILQIPEDMIRAQEVICQVKPDVIIETGVAHGGSLVFYSEFCNRVIGIEKGLRCRAQISAYDKDLKIWLIEGDSISFSTLSKVRAHIRSGIVEGKRTVNSSKTGTNTYEIHNDKVMVFLDSNHSKDHVLHELEAYSPLVTKGSYIVATDGSMSFLHDVPRAPEGWEWNNPLEAVKEFLKTHKEFVLEEPKWPFNDSNLTENVTHWPKAFLKRI